MLISSSDKEIARKALKGDALWKVLQKISKDYTFVLKCHAKNKKNNDDRIELVKITNRSVILIINEYKFELIYSNPNTLARVLVRQYNVFSQLENIITPDDLWSSGVFFIDF